MSVLVRGWLVRVGSGVAVPWRSGLAWRGKMAGRVWAGWVARGRTGGGCAGRGTGKLAGQGAELFYGMVPPTTCITGTGTGFI